MLIRNFCSIVSKIVGGVSYAAWGCDNERETMRHARHCALFMTRGLWRKLVGGLCIFSPPLSLFIFWAFPGGNIFRFKYRYFVLAADFCIVDLQISISDNPVNLVHPSMVCNCALLTTVWYQSVGTECSKQHHRLILAVSTYTVFFPSVFHLKSPHATSHFRVDDKSALHKETHMEVQSSDSKGILQDKIRNNGFFFSFALWRRAVTDNYFHFCLFCR